METSVLFLAFAGQVDELGFSDPARTAAVPDTARGAKARKKMDRYREKLLKGDEFIEAPVGRALVSRDHLAVALVVASLWRLHFDGLIALTEQGAEARESSGVGGMLRKGMSALRPAAAQVELTGADPGGRGSLEGSMLAVGAREAAGMDLVRMCNLAIGRDPDDPMGLSALRGGGNVQSTHRSATIMICRDAAIDAGLLSFAQEGDPGAVRMGGAAGKKKRLGRTEVTPHYVVADEKAIGKLADEFDGQHAAYLAFKEEMPEVYEAVLEEWVQGPDSGSAGGGASE